MLLTIVIPRAGEGAGCWRRLLLTIAIPRAGRGAGCFWITFFTLF